MIMYITIRIDLVYLSLYSMYYIPAMDFGLFILTLSITQLLFTDFATIRLVA